MLVRISFCLTFNRIAWSACAVSIRIATLSDEAWNDSMKGQAVVKAFIRQAFKVLNSVWCCFRVKFDDDFFSPLSKEMLPFFHMYTLHINSKLHLIVHDPNLICEI